MNFYTQFRHASDLYTDTYLAYNLYLLSQDYKDQRQYHYAFLIVFLAIVGPYIIQFSSMMNSYHHKGYFKG